MTRGVKTLRMLWKSLRSHSGVYRREFMEKYQITEAEMSLIER